MSIRTRFLMIFFTLLISFEVFSEDVPLPPNTTRTCILVDYALGETYPQSSCLFIDENKVMIKAGKNYFSGTSGNNRGPALHRYYRSMTLWGEFPATASTDETYYAYPKGIDGETMKLNRWAIRLFSSREQNN
ncbi:hypothetical protein [Parashewanella spongiae]|uniref:hypothetical protein n=1 Tax=Parashewanella spongiae TaxID=342950 RepID=UPI001059DE97|nr:hypothetical protein [Parashewanella spongiae]